MSPIGRRGEGEDPIFQLWATYFGGEIKDKGGSCDRVYHGANQLCDLRKIGD